MEEVDMILLFAYIVALYNMINNFVLQEWKWRLRFIVCGPISY